MKDISKEAYASMKVKMKSIGRVYRDSKRRMELYEAEHIVQMNLRQYRNDASYVRHIDRVLADCDEQTRFIIRNEYLKASEKDWYSKFYAQSTFYRYKKKAVQQFDRTLKC